ncbi:MAG: hypothetical protein JNL97_07720, partial [Verrucomicrobiales bacterium]|nr:hypothetical protein [Verrucomicrobiales bacterium]
QGRPRLADIGLVIWEDATRTAVAGTPGFLPWTGEQDKSGDLYALGKVLYMMHTGLRAVDFPREPADLAVGDAVERREHANLRAVYDRACDPEPAKRHATASELRDELASVLGPRPMEDIRRLARRRRRFRIGAWIGAAMILTLLSATVSELRRLRAVHRGTLVELENRKLSRLRLREGGWSDRDWDEVRKAASRRSDPEIEIDRRAVATLSGLDARLHRQWKGVEAGAVAVAANGRILVAGFGDGAASLVTNGERVDLLGLPGYGSPAWSPAGEALLMRAETEAHAFVVREAESGEERSRWSWSVGEQPWGEPVPVMTLAPGGGLAAAAVGSPGRKPRVVVWDTRSGREEGTLEGNAASLAIDSDSRRMAVGLEDGGVLVVGLAPFGVERRLPSAVAPSPVRGLAFGRDVRVPSQVLQDGSRGLLAVGHQGTGIVVWDLALGVPRTFCHGSPWEVVSVAFLPDGMTLVSAGRMGVRYWDLATGSPLLWTLENSGRVRALAVNAEGTAVVSGTTSEAAPPDLCVWEVESHRGVRRLRGLSSAVRATALSADGGRLVALSDEWLVGVWDVARGRLLALHEVPAGEYADGAGLEVSSDGRSFGYANGGVALRWSTEDRRMTGRWTLPPASRSSCTQRSRSDGTVILARTSASRVVPRQRRWEIFRLSADGKTDLLGAQGEAGGYSTKHSELAPGGSHLLVLSEEPEPAKDVVRCIDVETGTERWSLRLRDRSVWFRPRFDPSGRWVATLHPREHPRWARVRIEDGEVVESMEPCFALGPDCRLVASLDWVRGFGRVRWADGSRADLPLDSDGQMLADGSCFSAEGGHVAWGCIDGTVVVTDLEEVRERMGRLPMAAP